ncbi:MAG: S1/P1 nuclease [Pseudohongiellaceae bacterium]
MRHPVRYLCILLLSCAASLSLQNALAWDSAGHRVSAAIANHYLSDETRRELLRILQQHPRYREDFLDQMPNSVASGDEQEQFDWLLGQAAFWPDITRGLPEAQRSRYNRANWHYIDGAWLRGAASIQGNSYIGAAPFADIAGTTVYQEAAADNVMTALDFNSALLADQQAPLPQRAVALCWVLHLIGDIHQPLHVGSLYSARHFRTGDRGGNGVETDQGNLHARWDRALRDEGIRDSFNAALTRHSETLAGLTAQNAGDWSVWMNESRALLLNTVYTEEMKTTIARVDSGNGQLPAFELDNDYVETMKYHAGMRLALAGRRLALWLDENL